MLPNLSLLTGICHTQGWWWAGFDVGLNLEGRLVCLCIHLKHGFTIDLFTDGNADAFVLTSSK